MHVTGEGKSDARVERKEGRKKRITGSGIPRLRLIKRSTRGENVGARLKKEGARIGGKSVADAPRREYAGKILGQGGV